MMTPREPSLAWARRAAVPALALWGAALTTTPIAAQKLRADYGYFSLRAKTSTGSSTVSNPAYLGFTAAWPLRPSLTLDAGYSLYAVNGDGLELGYGPNLGLSWFPWSAAAPSREDEGRYGWASEARWRPYASVAFQQRQFQSVQTGYAGMGLGVGAEYQASPRHFAALGVTVAPMRGPLKSSATELRLTAGLGYNY